MIECVLPVCSLSKKWAHARVLCAHVHNKALVVQVYMASSDGAAQANCTIDLFDSQGQVTDTEVLSFVVNATVFESLPDPMAPPAVRTTESFSPSAVVSCIEKCGMFNAVCLWWRGCTGELAKLFGGIAGGLIGRVFSPSQAANWPTNSGGLEQIASIFPIEATANFALPLDACQHRRGKCAVMSTLFIFYMP